LFKIYVDRYGVPIKIFVVANIIYLLSALVQLNLGHDSLSFLNIPNGLGGDIARGVHSLTPEPTYFGILLFFLNWIYLVVCNYKLSVKIKMLFFINIMFIIFVAKSSMTILFILVSLFVYLLSILKKKNVLRTIYTLFFSVIVFIITIQIFLDLNPDSRVANLIFLTQSQQTDLFDSIITLINFDKSINDRVLNVVFPYFGFYFNYFLPGGFYSYADMSVVLGSYFDSYFWAGFGSNKIMSFVGSFIYELGYLGVMFFVSMYIYLRDSYNSRRKFEIVLLFIILNSAIPVSFSFVPILVALMLHHKGNYLYKVNLTQ
jgi:hypothetical protein